MTDLEWRFVHANGVRKECASEFDARQRARVARGTVEWRTAWRPYPATASPAGLPNPVLVESDRQSSGHWDEHWPEGCGCDKCVNFRAALIPKKDLLGSASALEVEAGDWKPVACTCGAVAVGYSCRRDCARVVNALASATKPEGSPSPESELQDAEIGAAIRPRAEGVRLLTLDEIEQTVIGRIKTAFYDVALPEAEIQRRAAWAANGLPKWGVIESVGDGSSAADVDGAAQSSGLHESVGERQGRQPSPATTSTTSAERSPSPESSRPVSTDEEEGRVDSGGEQGSPCAGESNG